MQRFYDPIKHSVIGQPLYWWETLQLVVDKNMAALEVCDEQGNLIDCLSVFDNKGYFCADDRNVSGEIDESK